MEDLTINSEIINDEDVLIKIMEQNLQGVMFHLYQTDYFDFLNLEGFKKMHHFQSREESDNLECLKHKYIKEYKKLPILKTKEKNYWEAETSLSGELPKEKINPAVKKSMEEYVDWESNVLEHLISWKRNVKDKAFISKMIDDVMEEIKRVETIIDILEDHKYNCECINEMSEYLYKQYKGS